MHYHYYNKYGIALPIGQKIGTPFMIGHIPGIIINGNATIGNKQTGILKMKIKSK